MTARLIEFDLINGISEIDAINDEVFLTNFDLKETEQWLITDEQFEYIDQRYGIKKLG